MGRRFITEVVEQKKKALIVYASRTGLVDYIRQKISENYEVYETAYHKNHEHSFTNYDLAIFINIFPHRSGVLFGNHLNIFFFFYDEALYKNKLEWCKKHLKEYKIVYIEKTKRSLKEIINFVLFKTHTPYSFSYKKTVQNVPFYQKEIDPKKAIYQILWFILLTFVSLNLLFFASFAYELYALFSVASHTEKTSTIPKAQLKTLKRMASINETLVLVPKNSLFFVPGVNNMLRFYETVKKTVQLLDEGENLVDNYVILAQLFLKKNKTDAQKQEALLRIEYVGKKIDEVGDLYFSVVADWKNAHIPFFDSYRKSFVDKSTQFDEYVNALRAVTKELSYLTGAQEKRRYLILFMNNMELRPGGGFIGSLGVVDFYDFSMKELKVYDVYTLDGQLKIHVDPPLPISKYLAQPHWFLRDSNFSPDFPQNTKQALRFIKNEVAWEDFDGVIGVTFTGVQKIVSLFPDLYVTGYDERVSSDNFFIKAQSYAERGFFAGSHGKRNFLESVVRSLLVRFDEGNFDKVGVALATQKLLDEKQVVMFFQKESLQSAFDKLFWTGRVVKPGCNVDKNCFFDYLMVVDANLGVNKANFFIQRSIRLITEIGQNQEVKNTLVLNYKNESIQNIFPGGEYKNYIQIYLPREIRIKEVRIEGKKEQYEESVDLGLTRVGMWAVIKEGEQRTIEIEYVFGNKFDKTRPYQLVVQKQIGSINTDFIYEMRMPNFLSLRDSNFTPVVARQGFVYNTYLEKDRLLLIWFK